MRHPVIMEETQMDKDRKQQWTEPTVEELDISDETQVDPGTGPDVVVLGIDPAGS